MTLGGALPLIGSHSKKVEGPNGGMMSGTSGSSVKSTPDGWRCIPNPNMTDTFPQCSTLLFPTI